MEWLQMWQTMLGRAGPLAHCALSVAREGKIWLREIFETKNWSATFFLEFKKRFEKVTVSDKMEVIQCSRHIRALPTSPWYSPLCAEGFLLWTPAPLCKKVCSGGKQAQSWAQLSTAPETALNQWWPVRWVHSPASSSLTKDNAEACSTSVSSAVATSYMWLLSL